MNRKEAQVEQEGGGGSWCYFSLFGSFNFFFVSSLLLLFKPDARGERKRERERALLLFNPPNNRFVQSGTMGNMGWRFFFFFTIIVIFVLCFLFLVSSLWALE